ncbi:MAG: dihydroorotase [Lentisphaeria bacterium]
MECPTFNRSSTTTASGQAADGAVILRGGRVIDPASGEDRVREVALAGGVFVSPASVPGARVVDVSGLVVAPGFIDAHVHLRDPGQTAKEDLVTGTRAAAAGGFATVIAMPNTVPPLDTPARVAAFVGDCRKRAVVRVLPSATLTLGRDGREPADAAGLKAAGAVALTDDGACVQDAAVMRRCLLAARAAGLPVTDHCEDAALARGGAIRAGPVADALGVRGIPAQAEEVIAARNLLLARETGQSVHLQHISSAGTVAILERARALGVPLTAEITPHHLALTVDACRELGSQAKMNPPLGTEADRRALLAALAGGLVTVIATDHAPHTAEEKGRGLAAAPFGIIGLESAVPVCLERLVHGGVLSLMQLVAAFTTGPAAVFGLPYGTLALGAPADLTLFDPDAVVEIRPETFQSKARNCPFAGWRCRGRVAGTVVAGRWVFGDPMEPPVRGG